MGLSDAQRAAYSFFRQRATDQKTFDAADLERVAGWKRSAFKTYKTKHLRDYISGRGAFKVHPKFLRLTEGDFGEIVGQSRTSVARFHHVIVHDVVQYEFLLPLTNERRLREALDELFFRETLELRAKEIGREDLSQIISPHASEPDEVYYRRVAERVGTLLAGYSIGHVHGRFRASPLLTYEEAARVLADRGRYLVDETTAVVRFILPIAESRQVHGAAFDVAAPPPNDDVSIPVDAARRLFIAFFVESVILRIHGEDEIWFLESGPNGQRLYVLERDGERGGRPKGARQRVQGGGSSQIELPGFGDSLDLWLRQNGYTDIAGKIEGIVTEWRRNGLRTRRNWWDILAGDKSGNQREVAGERFPIIAAIRKRQGLPSARGALWKPGESPLPDR